MCNIAPCAGEEIVDAKHFMPITQKSFAQMRSKKSGAAGDQNAFLHVPSLNDCARSGMEAARERFPVKGPHMRQFESELEASAEQGLQALGRSSNCTRTRRLGVMRELD